MTFNTTARPGIVNQEPSLADEVVVVFGDGEVVYSFLA
jgi:hypothetical protein